MKHRLIAASLLTIFSVSSAFAQGMPMPGSGPQGQQQQHNQKPPQAGKPQGNMQRQGQGGDRAGGQPNRQNRPMAGQPQGNPGNDRSMNRPHTSPQAHDRRPQGSRWSEGRRLPQSYRHNVINDYGRYRLPPPRRGYYWVRVGDQYLMVSAITGMIVSMVQAY